MVDSSEFADVHRHTHVCSSECVCLPPIDRIGTEYDCSPAPQTKPKYVPAIGTRYLTHLFFHPDCVRKTQRFIYNQLPKRACGQLAGSDDQVKFGWGVYFEEGWHWKSIYFIMVVLLASGSSVFGITWSVTKGDIQGGFAISSAWMTLGSVVDGLDLKLSVKDMISLTWPGVQIRPQVPLGTALRNLSSSPLQSTTSFWAQAAFDLSAKVRSLIMRLFTSLAVLSAAAVALAATYADASTQTDDEPACWVGEIHSPCDGFETGCTPDGILVKCDGDHMIFAAQCGPAVGGPWTCHCVDGVSQCGDDDDDDDDDGGYGGAAAEKAAKEEL
ncbi:hypothetical protein B0H66DRAFT_639058 [Apodospora peruviana]|uniref:Uncharacterized protein n=1 Tax=Apodospora peruviana TaxID=516989 RepID=A0AAE0M7T0_9PEZI|nr:hypothetical protein B0H66DRAFT_639058 [Apodospora peruviana]